MVTKYSEWQIFTAAVALRVAFIVLGVLLDRFSFGLQYTDIDYHIFSDAAGYVSAGVSPYERSTYRYPPIVALLLIPNQWMPSFGKLVFSIADAACCLELCRCQSFLGDGNNYRYAWLWAVNIASINICTRGSADSLTNYLVILLVRLLLTSQWKKRSDSVLVGAVLGTLIYLRIYPVIYAPAVVVYLLAMDGDKEKPRYVVRNALNTALFLQSALAVLVLLGSASYYFYGQSYWENAVTYHMSREDHRHNFSVHFLGIYLSKGGDSTYASRVAQAVMQMVQSVVGNSPFLASVMVTLSAVLPSVVLFLPQLVLFGLIVLRFAPRNLPVCLLLQTMVFVAYNKVITAQYFTWYMCLLPLAAPSLCYIPKRVAVASAVVWGAATGYWLYTAYLLEFAGHDNFVSVWNASLLFHWASAALIGVIVFFAPIAVLR